MPRPKLPKNLDDLASAPAVGKTIIDQMNRTVQMNRSLNQAQFDPHSGLMLLPPDEGDPPELYDIWALSQQVRAIDQAMESDPDNASKMFSDRYRCIAKIADIKANIRKQLDTAGNTAFKAMIGAERLDIDKFKADYDDSQKTLNDGKTISVENLMEAFSAEDLEAMATDAETDA